MITIDFTFSVVTEESVREGDTAREGFFCPYRRVELCEWYDEHRAYKRRVWCAGELRDALRAAVDLGISQPSDWPTIQEHTCFSSVDNDTDWRTGETRSYALHIAGVTLSTKRRVWRYLNSKPIFGG